MPEEPKPTKYFYKSCPIKEAVVEIRFSMEGWDLAIAGQIYDRLRKEFPVKKTIEHIPLFLGPVGSGPIPTPPPLQAPVLQMANEDGSSLIQVGPGIATANVLSYTKWENFIPAIRAVVSTYIDTANPKMVTRIATRYINRIEFAGITDLNLAKYFNFGLKVPDALFQLVGFELTFMTNLELKAPNYISQARTIFATDKLDSDAGSAIMLDIDCFSTGTFQVDSADILGMSQMLHDKVEEIFEGFLKDDLREHLGATKL